MTPALRQFLADWLAWAEAGAPEHPVFRRDYGLCGSLQKYAGLYEGRRLEDELLRLFNFTVFPFGSSQEFHQQTRDGTQHENPARLAWVRQQLGVE